ncbi:MAG TPA: hypothetical protein VFO29_11590 [Candidatus Rubrimentiphilum sp.]|nr:hypothetical protein [Candidatus Rubrimentiphilum sp.]
MKESPADLELYGQLKRSTALGALVTVALAALVLAVWHLAFALVLLAGGVAGVVNALLSMFGNERLLDRRNVGAFVLSSFLRLCVFGIVPVALAVRLPSIWTLAWYFIGFFTPLGLFAVLLRRAVSRK